MEFIRSQILPYAKSGQLFIASNTAAQALSVGLTTTYTGLVIGNALGNTKNLHLIGCGYALSVAPAAVSAIGLLLGYSATTALTAGTAVTGSPQNAIVGSAVASVAVAKSATTLGATPLYGPMFGSEAPTTQLTSRANWIDLRGMIVVPPGGFVAWAANAVVTGFFSFVWAELNV